jgi:DDE domain
MFKSVFLMISAIAVPNALCRKFAQTGNGASWMILPSILNYFRRFSQAEIERFWRPLWRWLISRLPRLEKGFSLDLDSTIFSRHSTRALYRAVDKMGLTVDFLLSRRRDIAAAKRFFSLASLIPALRAIRIDPIRAMRQ